MSRILYSGYVGAIAYAAKRRTACRSLLADLVADDAADCRAANRPEGAATGQNGAADGSDSGPDGGVLVPGRHICTAAKDNHQGDRNRSER
jgi:hypothetical protein